MPMNRQLLLDNRPMGEASTSNFKLVITPTPELTEGEVLVRHHFLSLDPYMRGRMNDGKSYAQPQPLGQVMIGGTAGEVVESRHPRFAVGDMVVGRMRARKVFFQARRFEDFVLPALLAAISPPTPPHE